MPAPFPETTIPTDKIADAATKDAFRYVARLLQQIQKSANLLIGDSVIQPAGAAAYATGTTTTAGAASATITLNTQVFVESFTFGSNTFTAQVAGVYSITMGYKSRLTAGTGTSSVGYRINGGSDVIVREVTSLLAQGIDISEMFLLALAVNDTFEARHTVPAATTLATSYMRVGIIQVARF